MQQQTTSPDLDAFLTWRIRGAGGFHLSRVANRAGFGPDAVVRRIEKQSSSAVIRLGRRSGVFSDQLLDLDELADSEQIEEACRRLLGYVQ